MAHAPNLVVLLEHITPFISILSVCFPGGMAEFSSFSQQVYDPQSPKPYYPVLYNLHLKKYRILSLIFPESL